MVQLQVTIPPGGTTQIDLTNIPLGEDHEKGYKAVAFEITTYEFVTTGTIACMFFETTLRCVAGLVTEPAAVS
jgi:hypothetical protein